VRDALTGVRIAELPVTLRFWDGSVLDGGAPVIEVRDPVAIAHILHAPGQLGLARAWVAGALDVEDVADLEAILRLRSYKVELTPRDIARLFAAAVRIVGPAILKKPPVPSTEAPRHRRGLHSLARDKAAIRHHYDVSNAFYELILGPTMVYSCAYFAEPGESLEAAQTRKLDTICRSLQMKPGDQHLDLGCGWGGLLVHAAKRFGTVGTGYTLATEQAEFGRERVEQAGMGDRVQIVVDDYRTIQNRKFDKITCVEMAEHVGIQNFQKFLIQVKSLLKDDGMLSLSFNSTQPWVAVKLMRMVAEATGTTPIVYTHGGQLMLNEKLGAGPALFRYWTGLYRQASSSLVVSNGVGNWFPLRIGAPAEIVHLTLRSV